MSLTGIILAKNEEANLPFAIASLQKLGAFIFVVDSGSTDGTVELAKSRGCAVAFHPWKNHSDQFSWAMHNCPFDTDWFCRLDADEYLTDDLIDELAQSLPRLSSDVTGLDVKRRVIFLGKWIRHGGVYPIWSVRFWRKGCAKIEDNMDEHIITMRGRVIRLRNDLVDYNRRGLGPWIDKHNFYSDREAADYIAKKFGDYHLLSGHAAHQRFLKTRLYYQIPPLLRAFVFWFYRYIFRLGFLDGTPGYLYQFLQAYWYRTLVDAKVYEYLLNEKSGAKKPPAS